MSHDAGKLWKRYGIALFLILTIITVSHLIESHAIQKAETDAEIISLSAKQSMLSQQIVLFAQAYIDDGDLEASQNLSDALDEFERAHMTLMADAAREASLGSLYLARTPSSDEIVLDYISIARAIPETPYPDALLNELKFKGTGIVLERLDEAVAA